MSRDCGGGSMRSTEVRPLGGQGSSEECEGPRTCLSAWGSEHLSWAVHTSSLQVEQVEGEGAGPPQSSGAAGPAAAGPRETGSPDAVFMGFCCCCLCFIKYFNHLIFFMQCILRLLKSCYKECVRPRI